MVLTGNPGQKQTLPIRKDPETDYAMAKEIEEVQMFKLKIAKEVK